MTLPHAPRRNADGSLDIDHYRRRARRLRHVAKRQTWAQLRELAAALRARMAPMGASVWTGARWSVTALACLSAMPGRAEPAAGGLIATPLLVEPLGGAVFRLYRLVLGPGTATVPAVPAGEEVVLVLDGAIVIEIAGAAPRLHRTGEVAWRPPMVVHVTRNASADAPATLMIGSLSAASD